MRDIKSRGSVHKFEEAKTANTKNRICQQVIQELEIHAKLEEEIFYPAVKKSLGEEEMVEEAKQEHQQAKEIMRELGKMGPEDERVEGKFAELVECVQHHVEEEEGEMLPKADESDLDLSALGEEMADRREELMQQMQKAQRSEGKATRKSKSPARRRRSGRAA